uniref:Sterol 14-demethylase-like n=1 Tax=Rhizophora mucronata TaxID=61149 RepID=A0A2P2Q1K4_RHIMU
MDHEQKPSKQHKQFKQLWEHNQKEREREREH